MAISAKTTVYNDINELSIVLLKPYDWRTLAAGGLLYTMSAIKVLFHRALSGIGGGWQIENQSPVVARYKSRAARGDRSY